MIPYNQYVQLLAVEGHGSGERKSRAQQTVLHAQCTSALSSAFPISQGNALDRWGGKTKHLLCFLLPANTSAKNYRNRIV